MLLIGAGIFLAAAMAEGVLRLLPGLLSIELQQIIRSTPGDRGVAHPYIGHLHKPNNTFILESRDFQVANRTDGYGFRNSWPWPNDVGIVAVGDSLTFGYGVEDDQAWPTLLEKGLGDFRLVNLGLIGAGPQQFLRVYETFGERLRPKVLLVSVFLRNDIWDDQMFNRWLKSGGAGNYLVWRDYGRPRSTRLDLQQPIGDVALSVLWRGHLVASRSRLYNLLHEVRSSLKAHLAGRRPAETMIFQARDGSRLVLEAEDFAAKTSEARSGQGEFHSSIDALKRLHSRARANGTEVLIILQPGKEEVYLPFLGVSDADAGGPLRAALGELGIPYLDLLPDFRSRAAEGEALFFEIDGHPNARGYALTAELVLDHLKSNAEIYGILSSFTREDDSGEEAGEAPYPQTSSD